MKDRKSKQTFHGKYSEISFKKNHQNKRISVPRTFGSVRIEMRDLGLNMWNEDYSNNGPFLVFNTV